MSDTRPTLYLSRLLPDPVMAIVRERFQLVQEPLDALPAPSALREGLCQADAAIVTLGDRIDAETIHAATRLKILANYAVGYNNIDFAAARQQDRCCCTRRHSSPECSAEWPHEWSRRRCDRPR